MNEFAKVRALISGLIDRKFKIEAVDVNQTIAFWAVKRGIDFQVGWIAPDGSGCTCVDSVEHAERLYKARRLESSKCTTSTTTTPGLR